MKDDIRYSEFLFLRALANQSLDYFNPNDPKQTVAIGLHQQLYIEMAVALIEDFIRSI